MAGIKERLIQVILRGKDLLSPEAKKGKAALDELRESGEHLRAELDKAKEDNNLARSLSSLGKESERAEKTAERTAAKVIQLRDELDKSPDSKGLAESLKSANSEAERAQKALDALKVKTSDFSEKAKAAGIDTSKLSDEEKRLAAELDKAKTAVTDNTKATKDLERNQRSAARAAAEQAARNTSLGNVLKSAEKKVLAYAGAYISLRAASRLASKGLDLVRAGIEKVISVGNGAEKAKIQLEGLMGSIEGGEQATAWIEDFADKTGQRIDDVIEAFAELKAYGLDPMDGSMQSIVDKTAQLGGETEKLKGISLAVGQMWAKEKIVQEEVNQLRERGVNAFDLLGKAMNKNVSELQDMAAAGQLGRKEIKLLIDEMGRSADGQAARSLETLSGKWNVLLNQFQKFGEEVASSGAMDIVKEKLQDLLDKVVELTTDGTLKNLAEALSGAFVEGIVKVEEFVKSLAKVDFKKLIDDSSEWLNGFENKINTAISAVTRLTAPFRILTNVVTGFGAAALTAFSGLVFGSLSLISLLAKAIPDAFGGDAIVKGLEKARDSVAGMMTSLASQVSTDFADIKDAAADLAGSTADSVIESETRQLAAVKKSYKEKKISAEEYLETLNKIKAEKLALIEVSESESTAAQQQLTELYNTSNQLAKMHADGLISTEAHAASQANLQLAIDQVKTKIDEAKNSFENYSNQLKETQDSIDATSQKEEEAVKTKTQLISELREEQKRLSEEFFAGNITQKEWEQGHNTANAAIMALNQTVAEAAIKIGTLQEAEEAFTTASTVAELEAFKKALFDAYSRKDINLEEFQDLHNKASAEIKKLGGSAVDATRDLSTLDGVMKAIAKAVNSIDTREAQVALDKLYKNRAIDAKQYAKAQEELNQKIAELKPAAETAKKSVDKLDESLGAASGGLGGVNDNAARASASMEWFTGIINEARAPLEQMSDAARDAFNELQGIDNVPEIDTSSLEGTSEALSRARGEAGDLNVAMSQLYGGNISDSLSRWATMTKQRGKEVEISFLQQKAALQALQKEYESGALSAEQFANKAADARKQFDLLDDSDLSALEGAVDAAKQKMDQLADSTKSTLQSLNDELLQLKGTQEEIEKSKMDSRRRDLQSQLVEARKDGDDRAVKNLQQALNTLSEIESERERVARNKKADDAKAEAEKAAQEQPAKKQEPTKIIKLQVGSQSVDVGVGSTNDEAALLSILEQAGLRSM